MKRKTLLQLMFVMSTAISILVVMGVYLWVMNNKQEIVLPVVAKSVKVGERILRDDIAYVEVNPNVMTPRMISSEFDLINNYSLRDIKPGEYFYADWVSTSYTRRLADKVIYGGVPVPTSQILSVNGEIRPDDFVLVTIVTSSDENMLTTNVAGVPSKKVKLIEPPELSAVRVLGIVDGSGIDINAKKSIIEAEDGSIDPASSLPQGSIVIFDCNEIQRAMLLQATYSGQIQLIILPEAEQQAHRLAWGLVGDNIAEEELLRIMPSQMTNEELEERRRQLQDITDAEVEAKIQGAAKEQGIDITPVEGKDTLTGEKSDERG